MNKDLLKVIAGLECCTDGGCSMCPYDNGLNDLSTECMDELNADALEILREVERDGLY